MSRAARPGPRRAAEAPRIRRAVPADAPRIAAVMRASVRALAAGQVPARTLRAWSSLPPLYHAWAMTAGGEAYLVAALGQRIVGYAALRGAELTAVFVHPVAARRGMGAALVRRVEGRARRAGVQVLRVRAALSALAFYRAMGFRGGRAIRVPLPGAVLLEARALAKPLAAPRPGGIRAVRTAGGTGSADRSRARPRAGTGPGARRSRPDR